MDEPQCVPEEARQAARQKELCRWLWSSRVCVAVDNDPEGHPSEIEVGRGFVSAFTWRP
jgi:hypothetical protein